MPPLSRTCQVEERDPPPSHPPPFTDDGEVTGSLERGGVEPVETLLKHRLMLSPPSSVERPCVCVWGSPSANWCDQGAHHLGAKHQQSVGAYMHLYDRTNTHNPALQPRGEAPASPPARAGQEEHLAPGKGHPHPPHPRSSTPAASLGGSRRRQPVRLFFCFVLFFLLLLQTVGRHFPKVNPRGLLSGRRRS